MNRRAYAVLTAIFIAALFAPLLTGCGQARKERMACYQTFKDKPTAEIERLCGPRLK